MDQLQATSNELLAALLRFLVRLVLAAAVTELLELQTAGGRLLVLRRRVVPLLALSALQCHNFPHLLILTDSGLRRLFANQVLGFRSLVQELAAIFSRAPQIPDP